MDFDWDTAATPFAMLPETKPWASEETQVRADWRVRHLAAGFLWESLADAPGYHLPPQERREVASCADVLDNDAPATPHLWSYLVRSWLKTRLPNYRTVGHPALVGDTTLPLAVAMLYRSRRQRGLASVLRWLELRGPDYKRGGLTTPSQRAQWVSPRMAALVRDVYPLPGRGHDTARRPQPLPRAWLTDTVVALASQMWQRREYSAMPILADALQDAGCDRAGVLDHCRDASALHCRGCWVLDLILYKARWTNRRRQKEPVRSPDGRYALTRVAALPDQRGVYDVCFRSVSDWNDCGHRYLTCAELDTRFPGWREAGEIVPVGESPSEDNHEPQTQEAADPA